MTPIEGQIEIDIRTRRNSNAVVEIVSSRPVYASQIMIGKTPEQALNLIPLIFSVCRIAQSRVSFSAIMQQLGHPSSAPDECARDMLVIAETAREHLFRIFMDWPVLFAAVHDDQFLPYINGLTRQTAQALYQDGHGFLMGSALSPNVQQLETVISELEQFLSAYVFQHSLDQWLRISDIDDLGHWSSKGNHLIAQSLRTILHNNWETQGCPEGHFLPELDHQQLLERFQSENARHFIAQPDWHGKPFETTTLSRQQSHPLIKNLRQKFQNTLITRWLARLVELAGIPDHLRSLLIKLKRPDLTPIEQSASLGIAQIEAARGKLIHRVKIEKNRISQYQILAPTEWNFHPRGLIQQSLSRIQASDKAETNRIARLLINAIDPCVGYALRIH